MNENLKKIIKFSARIAGWLSVQEGLLLYLLSKNAKEGKIVEIGSWKGKSTIFLGLGCKEKGQGKVYAVDPHRGDYGQSKTEENRSTLNEFKNNLSKMALNSWVRPIIETSKKAASSWNQPIDLLFIDGLHDFENCRLDFLLWSPFLKEKGFLVLHDAFCGYPGPYKVLEKYIFNNNNYVGIGVTGSIVYAQKTVLPNRLQLLIKRQTAFLINLAQRIDQNQNIFPPMKKFIVHKLLRFLLVKPLFLKIQLIKLSNYMWTES